MKNNRRKFSSPAREYSLRILSRTADALSSYHMYWYAGYQEGEAPEYVLEITRELVRLWKTCEDIEFLFKKHKRPLYLLEKIWNSCDNLIDICYDHTASIDDLLHFKSILEDFVITHLEGAGERVIKLLRESSRQALENCVIS